MAVAPPRGLGEGLQVLALSGPLGSVDPSCSTLPLAD